MEHLKQRLALLHEDMSRLLRETKDRRSSLSAADLKAILKVARDLESFAIGQIALAEQGEQVRRSSDGGGKGHHQFKGAKRDESSPEEA